MSRAGPGRARPTGSRAAAGPRDRRSLAGPTAAAESPEPLLELEDIQGNILTPFNKDRQTLIALRLRDHEAARAWLARIVPHISRAAEVGQFNALFRANRQRLGRDPPGLVATWACIAFSHAGLAALTSAADADGVPDEAFRKGLPARAVGLGDRVSAGGGDPTAHWVVGGTGQVPDVLMIIAGDDESLLLRFVEHLCPGAGDLAGAPEVIWREMGQTRSDLPGHEHFGFKDGISQPGVRGLVSRDPDRFLTPRLLEPSATFGVEFASPGTPLVWPGQFVFGYPSTNRTSVGGGDPVPPAPLTPPWLKNGSLLVFRRLRQDVAAFHAFLRTAAATLAATPEFAGMDAGRLGALLVGRWPSGAPIARTPGADLPALAERASAANDFLFAADTPPPVYRPGAGTPDEFPRAISDAPGFICPHAAHIRKVNPRDHDSNLGDQFDTLTRRILRRGIPYGPPLPVPPNGLPPTEDGADRGLHFLCFQTSIVDQFETLQSNWANSDDNPKPRGHDLIIGEKPDGPRHFQVLTPDGGDRMVEVDREFVVATGGGYFFAPSISAIRDILASH